MSCCFDDEKIVEQQLPFFAFYVRMEIYETKQGIARKVCEGK